MALCLKSWCLLQDRLVYLRGGTDLMPAPKWRKGAFVLDSRAEPQAQEPLPPPLQAGPVALPQQPGTPQGAQLTAAHRKSDIFP